MQNLKEVAQGDEFASGTRSGRWGPKAHFAALRSVGWFKPVWKAALRRKGPGITWDYRGLFACLSPRRRAILRRMAASPPDPITTAAPVSKARVIAVKTAALVLLAVLLGVGQSWMAPRYYGPEWVAGFHTGVIEGALMPAAFPALLMGKDVPIYAQVNEGRPYKIGYVLGINACGTVFFGLAFWPPRKRGRAARKS